MYPYNKIWFKENVFKMCHFNHKTNFNHLRGHRLITIAKIDYNFTRFFIAILHTLVKIKCFVWGFGCIKIDPGEILTTLPKKLLYLS